MDDRVQAPGSPLREQLRGFRAAYGKELTVAGTRWRYYRLGQGPAVVWLTGGLRRAALGCTFLELLAGRFTVVAPDYPALKTFAEFDRGLTAILRAEGIGRCQLVCQSYGGMLGQAYLARHPAAVERLVLSSTGPADFSPLWLPAAWLIAGAVRVLPEQWVKTRLAGQLARVLPGQDGQWPAAVRDTLAHDLTRADVMSHFLVAADVIRTRAVRRGAFRAWAGQAVSLSAANDPTQGSRDRARCERLLGRPVTVISMGQAGHLACLADPPQYVAWLQQALT